MKSVVFACVLIHLHVQRNKICHLNPVPKKGDQVNLIKIVETLAERLNRVQTFKSKEEVFFNQWRKQPSKQKKVVYYIGVQNFLLPLETWSAQETCWHTLVCCVPNLWHHAPLAANDKSLNWHRSQWLKPSLKTASFSGVMIKANWAFVFIQSNKNKVFLTTVLIPCNSENTLNF